MNRDVPRALADATVLDENKQVVRLGDVWAKQPVVLTFVRHFGCIFCREHVVELQKEIERVHQLGAEIVVIGNGAPHFIPGFRELTGFDGPIYTDPSRRSYDLASMKRGWSTFLNARAVTNLARAFVGGARQGSVQGDPSQQGGTLVVAPPGRILFHHVSETAGDHPKLAKLLAVLEAEAAKPQSGAVASQPAHA
jgi:peroxiredoxin